MSKILGIVFSDIHDKNIQDLTTRRTFASVPFGGRYRLIDFVLSSMVNSGIDKVGVITKENYQSLMDHCGSGKSWDLARKNGGLMILPPYGLGMDMGLYANRLEALYSIIGHIERSSEKYVVMSDCDSIANIDYADALKTHEANNASFTLVYRKSTEIESGERGVLDIDETGRVRTFEKETQAPIGSNLYTNMLIVDKEFLLRLLVQSRLQGGTSLSRDIFMRHASSIRIFGYEFKGYFANINSMQAYFKHNLEMLDKEKRDSLFLKDSPIYTKNRDSAPTKYTVNSNVYNSLIADGCLIEGTVRNSILFRGVHVAKDAIVENCILMQDTSVSQRVEAGFVIADKNVVIREGRKLNGCEIKPYYISKNMII